MAPIFKNSNSRCVSHFDEVHAKSRPGRPSKPAHIIVWWWLCSGTLTWTPPNQTTPRLSALGLTLRASSVPDSSSFPPTPPSSRKMGLSECSPNKVQFFILYYFMILLRFSFSFFLYFGFFSLFSGPCRSTSDPLVQPYSIDVLALTRTAR
jgi:hypothetical protein